MTTPYRIPAGTTEITYTRGAGEQRSIPVDHLNKRYSFAQPADDEDEAHLVGLGFPVARKVLGEQEDEEPKVEAKDEADGDQPETTSEATQPASPVESSAGTEG